MVNIDLRKQISQIVGFLSAIKFPKFFLKLIIKCYTKIYHFSIDDYLLPENEIKCFDDFFSRGLKDNVREIQNGIVSPVDGMIYASGLTSENKIVQIKSQIIDVKDLLLHDIHDGMPYVCLYLSPADYHRVHAPCDMQIVKMEYIPGTLYTVCPRVASKKAVFLKNERVVINAKSNNKDVWIVMIGAKNVGKMSFYALNGLCPREKVICNLELTGKVTYKKGEEIARFHMGSSVVVLAENICPDLLDFKKIRMGESLV